MSNPGNMPTPADGAVCRDCGQGLWCIDSRNSGVCARCRETQQTVEVPQ